MGECPLGVISINGKYRSGKSYLLNNLFMEGEEGFKVSPSVNTCTKGLWLWTKTLISDNPAEKDT